MIFDLTNLSPIWLGTYEYMKNTPNKKNKLKRDFQTGFLNCAKSYKSDPVLVYMKKSKFWAFFGP